MGLNPKEIKLIRKKTSWLAAALLALLCLTPVIAQPPGRMADEDMPKKEEKLPKSESSKVVDNVVTTQHRVTIGGKEVRYTANAGTLVLREEDGRPRAHIFFIAYTRDGVTDLSKRPVTFTFNGGPGSSSVWLHLGAFGPRRVEMDDEGQVAAASVPAGRQRRLAARRHRPRLHRSGDDRLQPGRRRERTRRSSTASRRTSSPSASSSGSGPSRYGRWSIAQVPGRRELRHHPRRPGSRPTSRSEHGMYLNGVVLISSILNFQTARFDRGNDLPYPLFLPTYTATAWYHKRLPAGPPGRQRSSRRSTRPSASPWASTRLALMQGNDLGRAGRNDIAAKVARYTGLSAEYVERTNLRPEIQAFVKELLRDRAQHGGPARQPLHGDRPRRGGRGARVRSQLRGDPGPVHRRRSTTTCARTSGSRATCPTRSCTDRVRPWNYAEAQNQYAQRGRGPAPGHEPATRPCRSSWATATTTWRPRTSPPSTPSTTSASIPATRSG